MSKLQVDDIVNKDDTGSVGFSRGAVVTGVATAASSVVAGIVTANVSGIHAGVGIITARGLEATGIVTATSFKGSASGLTAVPSAQLSGALPALDGSALTNLNIPAGFTELDAALFN